MAKEITDEQLTVFMRKVATAGDRVALAVCLIALDWKRDGLLNEHEAYVLERLNLDNDQAKARAEVARMIDNAAALYG
jgi:hypothetical protein